MSPFFGPVFVATFAAAWIAVGGLDMAATPFGFTSFCLREPAQCDIRIPYSAASEVTLTYRNWNAMRAVNTLVNLRITYKSDRDAYGVAERWTTINGSGFGDCEDYALTKRKLLMQYGFPMNALRIAIVLTAENQLHAVLDVTTSSGDYILDNRNPEVILATRTEYKFVMIQAEDNPRKWIGQSKGQIITN